MGFCFRLSWWKALKPVIDLLCGGTTDRQDPPQHYAFKCRIIECVCLCWCVNVYVGGAQFLVCYTFCVFASCIYCICFSVSGCKHCPAVPQTACVSSCWICKYVLFVSLSHVVCVCFHIWHFLCVCTHSVNAVRKCGIVSIIVHVSVCVCVADYSLLPSTELTAPAGSVTHPGSFRTVAGNNTPQFPVLSILTYSQYQNLQVTHTHSFTPPTNIVTGKNIYFAP